MSNLKYSIRVFWSPEDGEFVATTPEVPGVSALGSDAEEAVHELHEALGLALDVLEERGEPVPEPMPLPTHSGQFRVRLPVSLHAWLAERAESEGMSLNSLVIHLLSTAQGARTAADAMRRETKVMDGA